MTPIGFRILGAALVIAAFLGAQPATAAVFTVNDTVDDVDDVPGNGFCLTAGGKCTLRAAVQEANALAGTDQIVIPDGFYTLTIPGSSEDASATGDLDVTSAIEIYSQGAYTAPGNRPPSLGVNIVGDGVDNLFDVLASGSLKLHGLELGGAGGPFPSLVHNQGIAEVYDCRLDGSSGFGITNGSGGTLLVRDTGILGCDSGGVTNDGGATGTISNTSIHFIGGILSFGAVVNSGTLNLNNVTVAYNISNAVGTAGGISNFGTLSLRNTIISNNEDLLGGPCDCTGALTSQGYNIIMTPCGGCSITGDLTGVQTGVDPGVLEDDSYWDVPILALDPAGAAVNAGNPAVPGSGGFACEARDGLNYPRATLGGRCDVGAYEAGSCQAHPRPSGFCRTVTQPGKAKLKLVNSATDSQDVLVWKWIKGETTLDADFGDGSSFDYPFCVYDDTGLVLEAVAPTGGTCVGSPCWNDLATGLDYKDRDLTPAGLLKVRMRQGLTDGTARVLLKGKGTNLNFQSPPWSGTVTAQFNAYQCFQAQYTAPLDNSPTRYRANGQ